MLSFLCGCMQRENEIDINEKGKRENIYITDRTEWEISAEKHLAESDKLTDIFIAIAEAKDKPKPTEISGDLRARIGLENRRLLAIILLGELETKKAIQFLVDSITLNLEPAFNGEEGMIKRHPCSYVLRKSGWKVIPFILKALEQAKTDKEMNYLYGVLKSILGIRLSRAVIQSEIETFKDDKDKATYINNLNQIKQYLEKPDK